MKAKTIEKNKEIMTNTTATQVIQLVAPCDLDGGYLLDVELGGEIRTVLVVCLFMLTNIGKTRIQLL